MTLVASERRARIARMLSPNGKLSARSIDVRLRACGIEFTRRTLERDLQALVDAGEIAGDNAKPRGYKRVASPPFALRRQIDPAEAVVLRLAEMHLRRLLPAAFDSMFRELFDEARRSVNGTVLSDAAGTPRSPLAGWPDKVCAVPEWLPRIAPKVRPVVNEVVSEALLLGRKLELTYDARHDGERKTFKCNPLALVQRGPVIYLLVGTSPKRSTVLMLAMQRIVSAERLDSASVPPRDFDLQSWLASGAMQFEPKGEIRLELAVTPDIARGLEEAPLTHDQNLVPMPDGRWSLSATIGWTAQLEWWIRGMAETVDVIQPLELRDAILARGERVNGLNWSTRGIA